MERERPGPGDMKCLEPAMPEASDTPENSGYINQEISLFAFFFFCLFENHNQESQLPG